MVALDGIRVVYSPVLAGVTQSVAATCTGVSYQDGHGSWWCVTEQPHPVDAGARCLVFMSDQAARRVCTFPADWRRLSSDELETLSWSR